MDDMNHLDDQGNVHMVDVGAKATTRRLAVAEAFVIMDEVTADKLFADGLSKGDTKSPYYQLHHPPSNSPNA